MSHIHFDLLPQTAAVEGLLRSCMASLRYIPEPEKGVLIKAIREFETFGTPTAWSAGDVEDDLGLTEAEKREAIGRFLDHYDCKQADWDAIELHAQAVLAERE